MAEASWTLPDPAAADWIEVDGRTLGGMVAAAQVPGPKGTEGTQTTGALVAATRAPAPTGAGAEDVTQGAMQAVTVVTVPTGGEGTNTAGPAQASTIAGATTGQEGGSTTGDETASSEFATNSGEEIVASADSLLSTSTAFETIGGLKTPVLNFAQDRRTATAGQGVGTAPSVYDHTAGYSGSQLQLTTSEL